MLGCFSLQPDLDDGAVMGSHNCSGQLFPVSYHSHYNDFYPKLRTDYVYVLLKGRNVFPS